MTSYVFDLINRDGSIDTFELGAFDTDVEAVRYAGGALNASLTAFAVDVWSEGVRVGRVRRDVPIYGARAGERPYARDVAAA